MALESRLSRIKTALTGLLTGWTLSDSEKTDLIMAVLNFDFPASSGIRFSGEVFDINFREIDKELFRVKTNATFDDSLTITDAGAGSAVVELNPLPLRGNRLQMVHVTHDSDLGGTGALTFDLCLDANPADDDAGSFLSEQSVTQTFAQDLTVETYPTDHFVVKLTLANEGTVRAVRMRLVYAGLEVPDKIVGQVAALAARKFHMQRWEQAAAAGWEQEALDGLERIVRLYANQAKGLLNPTEAKSGGGGGGPLQVPGYHNKYRDKLLGLE